MSHKVLILGIDGYIGWPLANHLLAKNYQVYGLDNFSRRKMVKQAGSDSLTPILSTNDRQQYLYQYPNFNDRIANFNISDAYLTSKMLEEYKPDTIIHLAEQPSAPWSMRNVYHCLNTQIDNIAGTLALLWAMKDHCPNAHLIKLGTMGEYGTPDCDIPEGMIPNLCINSSYDDPPDCPMKGLPFPRSPGSFYHLSKVHDTHNIIFASRIWGLTSTDIMQGVVFGVKVTGEEDENQLTRFDYDQYFGTVINRFCAQALSDNPLTIYGSGEQIRGYIPLKDSIQCLTIAIENPPPKGSYRTLNQFENTYTINELAAEVLMTAYTLGMDARTTHIDNPRDELELHYYNPAHEKLFNLGYQPTIDMVDELIKLFNDLIPFKDRIITNCIMPTTNWRS
jgi:nucleoside-diphosphate-sugar epimerase